MRPDVRRLSLFALFALLATGSLLSAFGEDRPVWATARDITDGVRGGLVGTVVELDSAHNQLQVVTDVDRSTRIIVQTDPVSTRYSGFGGMVGDQVEVLSGAAGFSKVQVDDRVEVRGLGRANMSVSADQVILRGRAATATASAAGATTTGASTATAGQYEGIVRQVNAAENRFVIETDRREMVTVIGAYSTPVLYRGDTYHIGNIEVGDRVRVEPSSVANGEIRARTIDVVSSVSDVATPGAQDRTVGSISGQVTRIDGRNGFRLDTGRSTEVRVDASNATDDRGRVFRVADLQVGDRVTATGTYDRNDLFHASTIRFGDSVMPGSGRIPDTTTAPPASGVPTSGEYMTTVIYAKVKESLRTSPQLVIRDTAGDRTVRLHVSEDFVVQTKTGGYTTADALKVNDQIVVKAYRDSSGGYIAQTIRMR
jgi:hypothetical protein